MLRDRQKGEGMQADGWKLPAGSPGGLEHLPPNKTKAKLSLGKEIILKRTASF